MNSREYWKAFLDSGIPEYYLLYNMARKLEDSNVFNNTGSGASGITVQ